MRKILSVFAGVLCAATALQAQPVLTITAPKYDGSSSSVSGPNGTSNTDYHRAAFIVLKSELTEFAPFTNSVVTNFGLTYLNGANVAVNGNFTVYLQNTTNTSYSKGGTWSTIIAGMNQYYKGTLSIPSGPNPTVVDFALDSNFTYTGNGVYVVIEWENPGSTATSPAWYIANSSVANSGVRNYGLSAPTTLTATAFRPAFRFGAVNTATNELSVDMVQAQGHHAKLMGTPALISATVTNRSVGDHSMVPVFLNVGGANPFKDTLYPTIAAGASSVVTFNSYFPTVEGLSTISVSIGSDQNNANNTRPAYSQSVNCTVFSNYPGNISYSTATGYVTWNNSYGYGGTTGSGIFLDRFNLPTTTTLSGVRVAIGTATQNPGNNIFAAVLDPSGAILAQSPNFAIAQAGQLATINFTNSPVLNANQDYYIGIGQPASGFYPLAIRQFTNPGLSEYFVAPIGGGSLTAITSFTGYLGIAPVVKADQLLISANASRTFACKGETVTLTASGDPAVTYTWMPGNHVGAVVNITMQPIGTQTSSPAFYQVIGTHTPSGCQTEQTSLTLSVSLCTGLGDDLADYRSLELYPNPAVSGITSLHGLTGTNSVEVINLQGQLIHQVKTGASTLDLDLSVYPPSTYFVKVSNEKSQVKVFKVLTQ